MFWGLNIDFGFFNPQKGTHLRETAAFEPLRVKIHQAV